MGSTFHNNQKSLIIPKSHFGPTTIYIFFNFHKQWDYFKEFYNKVTMERYQKYLSGAMHVIFYNEPHKQLRAIRVVIMLHMPCIIPSN